MRGTALPPGDPRQRRSIAWTPMGRRALIRGNLRPDAACLGAASNPVRKHAYRLPGLGHVVFVSAADVCARLHAPNIRVEIGNVVREKSPKNSGRVPEKFFADV